MNRSSRNMNPMNNMMMNNGSGNMGMGMGMSMNRSSRNMNPMNGSMNRNSSPNNNIMRQRPLRGRHTRTSIATQTNLQRQQQQQQQLRNGHAMQQQSQVQPQQQQVSSPNSQRKPPLISSQPQRSPNGAGAGSVGRGGRAPRSHFPQQRPTRRPQTRNMYPSYQQ